MSEAAPVGSQRKCRFYFALRKLTAAERERFEDGGALPSGVGYDPSTVKVEVQEPQEPIAVLEGASVVKEGPGEYHLVVDVDAPNVWRWRARGYTGEGADAASTGWQTFRAA